MLLDKLQEVAQILPFITQSVDTGKLKLNKGRFTEYLLLAALASGGAMYGVQHSMSADIQNMKEDLKYLRAHAASQKEVSYLRDHAASKDQIVGLIKRISRNDSRISRVEDVVFAMRRGGTGRKRAKHGR